MNRRVYRGQYYIPVSFITGIQIDQLLSGKIAPRKWNGNLSALQEIKLQYFQLIVMKFYCAQSSIFQIVLTSNSLDIPCSKLYFIK